MAKKAKVSMATYRNARVNRIYANPYKTHCDSAISSKFNIGIAAIILTTCIVVATTVCYLTSVKQMIAFL